MKTCPPDAAVRHVYHLSPIRLLPLPLVWGLAMALLIIPFWAPPSTPEENQAVLIAAGVVTLIMLPFFGIIWQSRLVLTPEGIEHHQFGYTVRSSWANLESLSLSPGAEALYLREPGTTSRLLRISVRLLKLSGLAAGLVGDPTSIAEGRMIFLGPFMAQWKRGALRDDVLRWAPDLFDTNRR
ncbi:MAG: hypothetical protein ABI886_10925 [Betaproteobacteria bacterium]